MKLEFGFGSGTQSVEVRDDRLLGVLHANRLTPGLTGEDAVRAALDAPIGAPAIEQVVHPGEKIAIVTSDITRPCPTWKILPPLLDRLYAAGVDKKDITLVFALGSAIWPVSAHGRSCAASIPTRATASVWVRRTPERPWIFSAPWPRPTA